ncbi:MAG: 5'/3'-nucleotidase SurE [bacterium]|nr:5'/3'-nucleotidase SurE [bacterium]
MSFILVTNDDGVHAPGILALAQAMRQLGDVKVAAPSINQSASGHKKTLFQDIPFTHTEMADGTPALSVGGSPADCIALVALGALGTDIWPPRIVVSGINRGPNMGQDITYSGTVTAALEASIHGVPAVAVSLDNRVGEDVRDYEVAAQVALAVVQRVLEKQLPALTILNLNVPNTPDVKGIRLTRQGVRVYLDALETREGVYRIVGDPPGGIFDEEGTDLWAVHNGYASLTPIHLDMTAHKFMADLAAWDITYSGRKLHTSDGSLLAEAKGELQREE